MRRAVMSGPLSGGWLEWPLARIADSESSSALHERRSTIPLNRDVSRSVRET